MRKKDIGETKVTNAVDNAEEKAETAVKTRNFKKLKYGSMFYIIIALVIAIVVVLNIMASIMSKRSPMKIDITPDSRYELTEQSVNAVKALKKDTFVRNVLGEHVAEKYIEAKEKEWEEYRVYVTNWELEEYLYKY